MKYNYSLVLLATKDTIYSVLRYYDYYVRNLRIIKIFIIGPSSIKSIIEDSEKEICFIDEDTVLTNMTYSNVATAIRKVDESATKRTGWYFQQFLKMAYAYICEEDYYLVWDSDTIPLHEICMIDSNGKAYMDVKSEFNKPYFDTIQELGLKISDIPTFSFVSEHMLIEKKRMIELIETIEANASNQDPFWSVIIKSINPVYLGKSGFSEFETYGNYVFSHHRSDITIRRWKSLRSASMFYKTLDENTKKLHMYFDAISFEHEESNFFLSQNTVSSNVYFVILFERTRELLKKLYRIGNVIFYKYIHPQGKSK